MTDIQPIFTSHPPSWEVSWSQSHKLWGYTIRQTAGSTTLVAEIYPDLEVFFKARVFKMSSISQYEFLIGKDDLSLAKLKAWVEEEMLNYFNANRLRKEVNE